MYQRGGREEPGGGGRGAAYTGKGSDVEWEPLQPQGAVSP